MYFKYKLLTILNILDDSTDDDRGSDQTTSPHANKDCKCIIFMLVNVKLII